MLTSHSLRLDHDRIARAAVNNGVPIPAATQAVLEARGVDVGELERRLRDAMGFRR